MGSASGAHSPYRGRFAPSPTGPLHLGSVVAALASFLDAKAAQGLWLVRMEDLDPPREMPGAADDILRTLEKLHLHWDGPVIHQSQRIDAYHTGLDTLMQTGLLYRCRCSRLQLVGHDIYPGTCRHVSVPATEAGAIRCNVPDETIGFTDRIQGRIDQNLARDVGDFVLLRKDGLFAYQLAVVVDDGWQQITDIVRGNDLLDSTPRQLYLQRLLGLPTPRYAHIPLITDAVGQKLGKQQFAKAADAEHPSRTLWTALGLLRQQPEPALRDEPPAT
ncbi:MAG TPA: tRNA glutamyl-Q(34) synthetase GluQRS, partial [Candidatus Acidoferrum sp.]|nr:tRNA glutamyl-Q(34) synthetase GluQRS [Candidatus Acidoferrum sp.]